LWQILKSGQWEPFSFDFMAAAKYILCRDAAAKKMPGELLASSFFLNPEIGA